MRSLMFRPAAAAFLAIGLFTAPSLPAQKLAVQGKTPANPTLIIGIPDGAALWNGISASPLASKLMADEGPNALLPAETRRRLKEAGEAIGVDLTVEGFLTKTVTGLDFYLVEHADGPNFVATFAFQDAAAPGRLLDHVRKEAAAAYGVSAGISADTVIVDAATGYRSLYLPAFEIYLAADGNILVYSNQRGALESALENKGQAIFQSEYFDRYMSSLQSVDSQVWCFGEMSELTPIMQNASGAGTGEALEIVGSHPIAGKLQLSAADIKLSLFRHEKDMGAPERRFTLSAPPAGDVGVLNYFPDTSVFALGTNHFEAISFLEILAEALDDAPDAPITSASIEERLSGAGALLGFDPKNDLLANLGPELGLAITAAPDPAAGASIPEVVFVCGVKNRDSFKKVMDQLSGLAAAAAPPPPPARQAPPAGDQQAQATPTPQPTPAGPKTETIEGQEVLLAEIPGQDGGTNTFAWSLTTDSRFLFATSRDAMALALAQSKGADGSLLTSPSVQAIGERLSPARNALLLLELEALMPLIDANSAMLLEGAATEEEKAAVIQALDLLRMIRSLSLSTKYSPQGKLQEILILTK